MQKRSRIYLHIGSNLGNRRENLQQAQQLIEATIGTISKVSDIYETEAWGVTDQADFLNQAFELTTSFEAQEVLINIKNIEKQLGRKKADKWHERLIDIDLIFYNSAIITTKELIVPHPHIQERNFVLIPMMDIAADYVHPILKKTIEELYIESKDLLEVYLYN